MLEKLRTTLVVGCIAASVLCIPIQAASLEDSMLKPSTSSEEKSKDDSKEASAFAKTSDTITRAADLVDLSQEDRIQRIGEMCARDYAQSGVLASVSAAQCILESGYLTTELATQANNCFGMKATLSGNDWANSSWDGISVYTKQTGEEYGGKDVTIVADFRSYNSVEESVADHSAYLLGATVGENALRYEGLKGETDYREAITIIREGGYATDSSYIEKICSIIERFDLTRFDAMGEEVIAAATSDKEESSSEKTNKKSEKTVKKSQKEDSKESGVIELYRVRKTWEDVTSQIGAFQNLERARAACKAGYKIFDSQGNTVE